MVLFSVMSHDSIRGRVRPSVGPSVGPSVSPSLKARIMRLMAIGLVFSVIVFFKLLSIPLFVSFFFSREPQLYKRVCPSICWSGCQLVGR